MDRKRFELPKDYHWEPINLLGGRARLIVTDGTGVTHHW